MTPTHTDPDTGVRYLEPISYERVPEGWRVPDHERERWDNPPRHQAPRQQQQPEPKPVQQLVVELEARLELGTSLEAELRELYDREPMRVTRAVESVLAGIEARRLHTPGGLLRKLLRDISRVT